MRQKYSMKLSRIVDTHELNVIYKASDYDDVQVWSYNISRPSLQFVGFYDYFDTDRIQLMGKAEEAFLRTLDEDTREARIEEFFTHKIPALVVCHRVVPDMLIVEAARKHDITLLTTDVETSDFVAQLTNTLPLPSQFGH